MKHFVISGAGDQAQVMDMLGKCWTTEIKKLFKWTEVITKGALHCLRQKTTEEQQTSWSVWDTHDPLQIVSTLKQNFLLKQRPDADRGTKHGWVIIIRRHLLIPINVNVFSVPVCCFTDGGEGHWFTATGFQV